MDADHEYDPIGSNGYTDIGDQRFVQELYDGDGFRQARIDLGPWAGQEDVQIRFEFSTAGEARPDQSEVQAIAGDLLADGQTLIISGLMPDSTITNQGDALVDLTKVFEFDQGLVLQVPAGNQIDGSATLMGPNGPIVILQENFALAANEVQVFPTDSASDVADKIQARLGASVVRSLDNLALVGFTNEVTEGAYQLDGFASAVVSRPGIRATSSTAIPITIAMTDIEVRDAIQTAFATEIKYADTAVSLASFPVVGDTPSVRIYDLAVTQTVLGVPRSVAGNDDLASAQSLDDELFSLSSNSDIVDSTTRPHLTINGVGDGTYDYFSFTVFNAGDTATFDIDGAAFDTQLHLYDSAGNPLATNDDTFPLDPGSTSNLDSFISHTFAAPGVYTIGVAAFFSSADPGGITGATIPAGAVYNLHVSVDNQLILPPQPVLPGRALNLIQGEDSGISNTPGSPFGVYTGNFGAADLLRAGERSRGLGGDNGVYLDDIVIGLADRGESLTNSNQGTSFVDDPFFEPLFYDILGDLERPLVEELETGAYQLEIRLGREYLGSNNTGKDFRVGINERLAEGFNAEVVSVGSEIIDGDTFTLSNGFDTLTFEFSDVTDPALATPVRAGNIEISYTVADTPAKLRTAFVLRSIVIRYSQCLTSVPPLPVAN